MYIRTREGPAQGPLRYSLGDATASSSEMGLGDAKPCKPRFLVTHFRPGKFKLLPLHAKDIRDIAQHLVRFTQSQKVQAGITGKADIELVVHFEGHVDRKTDPKKFGTLDMDRATEVAWALGNGLSEALKGRDLSPLITYEYSAAGSQPISADNRRNRGVVICVRSITVKQASP